MIKPRATILTGSRDAPDLRISEYQGDIFAGWRRPADLLRARKLDQKPDGEAFVSVTGSTDLVQDVLTDCSVVASLCATTSRAERGLGKVRSWTLDFGSD